MGMDVNMLACVRALAENRIQDAKKYAVCCCANDNTKKNESQVRRCKNLLLNGPNMIELPANLNGLLRMEDVSSFHAERYYLGKTQWDLFEKIKRGVAVTLKLMEYGIPYKNSTLIYGVPGTGKTEFARYVAYSLGIPYAYINFSFLIDSYRQTSEEVKAGLLKPYVGTYTQIDFSRPCPSIFDTSEEIKEKYGIRAVRPLAPKTMDRIARGLKKFVLDNPEPFIIRCNHGGERRPNDIREPIQQIKC